MLRLFTIWTQGLFTVLPYDLPFLAYGKAKRARQVRVRRTLVRAPRAKGRLRLRRACGL
jgi:hypothetical protein